MRHKRPPVFERLVFGTAFVLAAIVLFYTGRKALRAWSPSGTARAAQAPAGSEEAPPYGSLLPAARVQPGAARDGVLNLPPLKVAGVGGRSRKTSEPPPPR